MSMHLGTFFFLSKFYISSKTYVLEDQTLYIFLKKNGHLNVTKEVKQRLITSILQTAMAL